MRLKTDAFLKKARSFEDPQDKEMQLRAPVERNHCVHQKEKQVRGGVRHGEQVRKLNYENRVKPNEERDAEGLANGI